MKSHSQLTGQKSCARFQPLQEESRQAAPCSLRIPSRDPALQTLENKAFHPSLPPHKVPLDEKEKWYSKEPLSASCTFAGYNNFSTRISPVQHRPKAFSMDHMGREKQPSHVFNAKPLSLRLPTPPLVFLSDPYDDLIAHLRRHGLHGDADNFAQAEKITPDFALQAWMALIAKDGTQELLGESNAFVATYQGHIQQSLSLAKSRGAPIPTYFSLPSSMEVANPTHFLAVHGRGKDEEGVLLPCHPLIYVLQCVSLPSFAPSSFVRKADECQVHVVPLCVPRPKDFPITHRYLYTRQPSNLMADLLPVEYVTQYQRESCGINAASWDEVFVLEAQPSSAAVEALSQLPVTTLLTSANTVHSAWANGVAIGILCIEYWKTLDQAWSVLVAALGIVRARLVEAELREALVGLPKKSPF